jgi:hypothetical protein
MEGRRCDVGCFCCVIAGFIAFAVLGSVLSGDPRGTIISLVVMLVLFMVGVTLMRS